MKDGTWDQGTGDTRAEAAVRQVLFTITLQ